MKERGLIACFFHIFITFVETKLYDMLHLDDCKSKLADFKRYFGVKFALFALVSSVLLPEKRIPTIAILIL